MSNGEDKYWYNIKTGEVELGFVSPAPDRVGPFDTQEQAANALQTLQERSEAWAAEEAEEDAWTDNSDADGN